MKPFNLEAALAGAPVQTRDGREVTQLAKFNTGDTFRLVGVIDCNIYHWYKTGQFIGDTASIKDLFMALTKKTGWVARYPEGVVCGTYTSEEQAKLAVQGHSVTYHEISWEE